jgi:hypothetical protein
MDTFPELSASVQHTAKLLTDTEEAVINCITTNYKHLPISLDLEQCPDLSKLGVVLQQATECQIAHPPNINEIANIHHYLSMVNAFLQQTPKPQRSDTWAYLTRTNAKRVEGILELKTYMEVTYFHATTSRAMVSHLCDYLEKTQSHTDLLRAIIGLDKAVRGLDATRVVTDTLLKLQHFTQQHDMQQALLQIDDDIVRLDTRLIDAMTRRYDRLLAKHRELKTKHTVLVENYDALFKRSMGRRESFLELTWKADAEKDQRQNTTTAYKKLQQEHTLLEARYNEVSRNMGALRETCDVWMNDKKNVDEDAKFNVGEMLKQIDERFAKMGVPSQITRKPSLAERFLKFKTKLK